ncbi:hypothetical protein Acr_00g0061740 [Actinidia rufa]|uniref:Uncharacterized protein n=1 Tax=Actinidia rufa TaxID=165716 RepID=A0A7J0DNR6_9ERIC|nr:hypothetical protein Acr_00g0061740 [Actinidia rufa]
MLMYVSETMANHLKLPSIVLRTSSATTLAAYGAMPAFHEAGYFPLQGASAPVSSAEVQGPTPRHFQKLKVLLQLVSIVCIIRTLASIISNTTDFLKHASCIGKNYDDNIKSPCSQWAFCSNLHQPPSSAYWKRIPTAFHG